MAKVYTQQHCLVIIFVVVMSIGMIKANQYCRHKWSTAFYYKEDAANSAADKVSVKPININFRRSPSDLLVSISDGSTWSHKLSKALPSGIFDSGADHPISDATFCNNAGDVLHPADVDGDHYDDLLCQKASDGSFTVRYYYNNDFMAEMPYAAGFRCIVGANHQLLIGDINGDNSEDLMCINKLLTSADNTPIYFSRSCHFEASFQSQHGHNKHNPRVSVWHTDMSVKRCRMKPGRIHQLPPGALPMYDPSNDKLIMLDSNGDGRMDVAAIINTNAANNANQVLVYASTGETDSVIFSRKIRKPQNTIAGATSFVIGADVDGDGDDDLIELDKTASSASGVVRIARSSRGTYDDFMDTPTANCAETSLLSSFCGAPFILDFFAADFNKDGRDDMICRQGTAAGVVPITTEILFSEVYP